jgi:hypothetical protein
MVLQKYGRITFYSFPLSYKKKPEGGKRKKSDQEGATSKGFAFVEYNNKKITEKV